ncbi:ATP-binding protein [Lutibacter sp.]|uniref:sensor histidine kinase n=1 Tax=Lutibacter sp. TaxID=1925666 RepID=UPI002735E98A|nr:ATP-binding protein [Lutibacter sp.]MDP3312201.1 ATP-binding protein [Lutibacter sp.]
MYQKKQLLQKLKNQNEQLNDYAHLVSHDLKSSLRSLSALLTWVKEDCSEKIGEESVGNLNLMEEKIEKMDKFLEDIINYSEIGVTGLKTSTIDLNKKVDKILDSIDIPKNIKVVVKDKLPVLKADARRLRQVFQNLISNAVNFNDKEEGLVEVAVNEVEDFYVFSIKDNGSGIPLEYHEKIFEIFTTLGYHEKSTGIGLPMAKRIIELYGGKIWLESEVLKGTTFYFTLPKNKANEA